MKKESKKKRVKRRLGRIPLPRQKGKPHSTKKGKRGYNRKRTKEEFQSEPEQK